MAEAAAAIRQPKKSLFQKEQLTDDQFLAHSSELADELQTITKISESGGVTEANGGSSTVETSEIQKEEDSSYIEAWETKAWFISLDSGTWSIPL